MLFIGCALCSDSNTSGNSLLKLVQIYLPALSGHYWITIGGLDLDWQGYLSIGYLMDFQKWMGSYSNIG